jgi:hypothetical protein
MIGRSSRVVIPAVTVALLVALTGCGKLGAHPATGSDGNAGVGRTTASAPATDDSGAIDGITQDLDSADAANTEAGSNADAGDQAGATGDEP